MPLYVIENDMKSTLEAMARWLVALCSLGAGVALRLIFGTLLGRSPVAPRAIESEVQTRKRALTVPRGLSGGGTAS